ncbi:hypothetical protein IFM89_006199, partial [Coptis chinensis]
MSVVNDEILRRHFLELTTNFLAPFGPYLRATTPFEEASPFFVPPPLPTFNADEFLESLSARGAGKFHVITKVTTVTESLIWYVSGHFYSRALLKGHNFMPWFQRRRPFLNKNIIDYGGRRVVQTLWLCAKKLKGDLQVVFKVLPKDMQQLLLFNPQTAALLQGGLEVTKVPGHPSIQVEVVSPHSP